MTAAPERGLHEQVGRDRPRQPEQDAGVGHRLDQEEEVRRAAAGQRGHRVLLRLRHADHLADRATAAPRPAAGARSAACAPAGQRAHRLVDQHRRVGHHPDHRGAGRPAASRERRSGCRPPATPPACSGDTCGTSSSSSASMSCGLTAISSTSARRRLGRVDTARTPYRSSSCSPRSARRATTTRSSAGRPARSSPDSSASPILPAPRTASRLTSSRLGRQRAQEEGHVRGSLGQPAHEVAVPLVPYGHVDAHGRCPAASQPALLVRADAVQHLVLVRLRLRGRAGRPGRRRSRPAAGRGWPPSGSRRRPSAPSGTARTTGRPRGAVLVGHRLAARRTRPCTAGPASRPWPGRGSRPRCGAGRTAGPRRCRREVPPQLGAGSAASSRWWCGPPCRG